MSRRTVLSIGVIAAVALLGMALDPNGFRHARRLEADVHRIEAENAGLRADNERLRLEIRRLADDPAALERAAREELGLVRPGDVVFRLEDGP